MAKSGSFVDLPAARRMEQVQTCRRWRYAEAYRALHPNLEVGLEKLAGGALIYCSPGSPLNRAVGLGMDGPLADGVLDEVERFYARRGEPERVDLCPLADPTLIDGLKQAGYCLEMFDSVLFQSLPAAFENWPVAENIRINQVTAREGKLWLRLTAAGFCEKALPDALTLDIAGPNFHSANAACFLARLDGQPAGGAAMFFHEGGVEFGGDSTLLEYRGRGIQTALIKTRMAAAHKMGCDLAIALTEPGSPSQRSYMRVGFQLAYTRAIMVKHRPGQPA
jgi:GNAT superfamily N-acetyltransferase